jgi:hypothetical protein
MERGGIEEEEAPRRRRACCCKGRWHALLVQGRQASPRRRPACGYMGRRFALLGTRTASSTATAASLPLFVQIVGDYFAPNFIATYGGYSGTYGNLKKVGAYLTSILKVG